MILFLLSFPFYALVPNISFALCIFGVVSLAVFNVWSLYIYQWENQGIAS